MPPIPESLETRLNDFTALDICVQSVFETKRRKRILEFPIGRAFCCLVNQKNEKKDVEFTSRGGLIIPYKDLNPFYFCYPENPGKTSQALGELGLEEVRFSPEEKKVEVVINKDKFRFKIQIQNKENYLSEETKIIISALLFLEPNQLELVKRDGILIGEYLPEEGENYVRGYILCVFDNQRDVLVPLRLKEYLSDNSDCPPGNKIPQGAREDLDRLSTFSSIVASWKKI